MEEVKVTRKYQVTIPKEIRVKFGVKVGDRLLLKKEEGRIVIEVPDRIPDSSEFLWNLSKKPINIDAVSLLKSLREKLLKEAPKIALETGVTYDSIHAAAMKRANLNIIIAEDMKHWSKIKGVETIHSSDYEKPKKP